MTGYTIVGNSSCFMPHQNIRKFALPISMWKEKRRNGFDINDQRLQLLVRFMYVLVIARVDFTENRSGHMSALHMSNNRFPSNATLKISRTFQTQYEALAPNLKWRHLSLD